MKSSLITGTNIVNGGRIRPGDVFPINRVNLSTAEYIFTPYPLSTRQITAYRLIMLDF
jgi:hypothetical protein